MFWQPLYHSNRLFVPTSTSMKAMCASLSALLQYLFTQALCAEPSAVGNSFPDESRFMLWLYLSPFVYLCPSPDLWLLCLGFDSCVCVVHRLFMFSKWWGCCVSQFCLAALGSCCLRSIILLLCHTVNLLCAVYIPFPYWVGVSENRGCQMLYR